MTIELKIRSSTRTARSGKYLDSICPQKVASIGMRSFGMKPEERGWLCASTPKPS